MSRINKQSGSKVVWIGLFLACSVLCQRTEAQVSAAKLSGTIADTSGATIAGAKIEITNVQTGITRNVLSNSSGLYSAPGLLPGSYTVSVSQESFATEVRTGITLDVGSDQLLNITLRVGTLKQEVAVSDIAAGVDLAPFRAEAALGRALTLPPLAFRAATVHSLANAFWRRTDMTKFGIAQPVRRVEDPRLVVSVARLCAPLREALEQLIQRRRDRAAG